jgi:recombining binding protein suppressor of hairless
MFPHDSVSSFHSQNAGPFDMMASMSTSLGSNKGTPLTPSDSLGGLQFSPGPQGGIKQDITDLMSDRRPPGMTSNTFQSDLHDDFSLGVNPHPNFASTNLPPFSDRLPRFPPDTFLTQSQLHGHPPDQLRGVPPQATHTRFEGTTHYDDIPGYLIPSPQNDLSLRIPSVEDTMMRIRMSQMGASTDFHTFIRLEQDVSGFFPHRIDDAITPNRPYIDQYVRAPNRLALGERTVIVMSSKVAQKSYGTEKR